MSALVQTVAAARYTEIGWRLFQGIYAEKLGPPSENMPSEGFCVFFFSDAELERGHQ